MELSIYLYYINYYIKRDNLETRNAYLEFLASSNRQKAELPLFSFFLFILDFEVLRESFRYGVLIFEP